MPEIPLIDVVGKGATGPPTQIGAMGEKIGRSPGVIETVNVCVVAH